MKKLKDIGQQVDYCCKMILQNQMTFSDFKICLNELTTRVGNATSLVEGVVVGPQPYNEGPPTAPSVIGRLVDPIGGQHPDVHRLSGTGLPAVHTISLHGPSASLVGPAVFLNECNAPHLGECTVFDSF